MGIFGSSDKETSGSKDPDYDKWMELSIEFINKKNYSKALEIIDSIADTENGAYWYSKGNILTNLKRFDEALKCYDKALVFDQRYVKAWYRKGWVLQYLKKMTEAIECFEKVLLIEGWLRKDFEQSLVSGDFNTFTEIVKDKIKVNCWSPAALITQTYAMIWCFNSRQGNITNKQINDDIISSYLVLRAYPRIVLALPNISSPDFINIKMPDFIIQNIQTILDMVEPPIVVEAKVKK